ncbi:hypothetical protein BKA82DRAFT_821829 [Pisolithus tinctorius]|uniref:Uncharacterized protein n=1 Tax=Pisolithus tinctorius Marx 270 TaxID=870435 RepID=A0A0C3JNP4_PISTI|nr:hypothetical protein BKA82DRAFT_821829 [Pisolithus tinctorius]KIN99121.1 hypothetical protein M404DRAFT_821829 [Pisolithus tinctorius Marx 270]
MHRKRAEKEKATGMKKDVDAKMSGASIKNRLYAWQRLRHLGQPQTDRLWMQNGAELFMLANESMLLAKTTELRWSFWRSGSNAQSLVDEDHPFLPFLFGYA